MLNALQDQYPDDLVILGFPCNQFNLQEPAGTVAELVNGIKYVRPGGGYEPNFKLFKRSGLVLTKVQVNGIDQEPIYSWLKGLCPSRNPFFSNRDGYYYDPPNVNDIRWNFEKFLIDKTGKPYMRFDPSTLPDNTEITQAIEYLISQ